MGISKCASFRDTVGQGWEIPVKNTFINFDIPSPPPAARVRSTTCPCSPGRRTWEHAATQELCHAMAPTRQCEVAVPRATATSTLQRRSDEAAKAAPRSDPAAKLTITAPEPEDVTTPSTQLESPTGTDADAISEVSTTSSERVDEKPCQSKWKSVQPRKKGKPAQGQQQQQQPQQQQQQPQQQPQPQHQSQQMQTSVSSGLPPTPTAKAPSRGHFSSSRHEHLRRQDTASSAHSPAAPHYEGGSSSGKGEGKGKGGGLLHFRKIEVGIEDDPHFRVVQRLIGPKGKHMQDILNQARGAKIWIIGRGSRSWEDDVGPLVVCVGAREPTSFETAVSLVKDLLSRVREDHSKFRR